MRRQWQLPAATAPPRRLQRAPERRPRLLSSCPASRYRKYGGEQRRRRKPLQRRLAPARPPSTFKPATLIEAPLAWDGSGLLPGESLSRHRIAGLNLSPGEPFLQVDAEPQGTFADAAYDADTDTFEQRLRADNRTRADIDLS